MMTSSVSLKEQVAILAKSIKMLAANVKEKEKQIAFMINKITSLTKKGLAISEQNQNLNLHEEEEEEEENSAKAAKESQSKANEMITLN